MAHSQSLANDLAGKVHKVMGSSLFREIFTSFQLMHGRESLADFRTTKNGGFKAGGFDSSITGRGAHLLLIDDSLSAHDTNSPVALARVIFIFEIMLDTRHNNPKSKATIIASHRIHENDLPGRLIRLGYTQLKLPFHATEDEAFFCRGVNFTRKSGELLQPERWPANTEQQLAPYVYATQYQQDPTALGSGLLQEHYFPLVVTCPSGGNTIISWDIASSTVEGRSYSVALVFQVMNDVAYLKHIFRERVDYVHLKLHALYLHSLFGPTSHLIESTSVGPALIEDLRTAGANVFAINPGGVSKLGRLEAVLNRIIANYVQPVRGIANLKEFFDECKAFPGSSHDDAIDALTQFLNWLNDNPPKPKREFITIGGERGSRTSPRDARTSRGRRRGITVLN